MKNLSILLFASIPLILASLACNAIVPGVEINDPRMSFDKPGKNITSTFSPKDDFYFVIDVVAAPVGTTLEARWVAVDVAGQDPDHEIEATLFEITEDDLDPNEETYDGYIYFKLNTVDKWPAGTYRVDLYVNERLTESLEFEVQSGQSSYQPPQPTATSENECSRLDLTAEECASLGKNLITVSGIVDGYCWYGEDDKTVTRDLFITVTFSNDGSGKKVNIENGIFVDCAAVSTGQNTYTYDCVPQGGNRHTGTIVFNGNGFSNLGGFTNSVNKNCTWSESYQIR